MGENAGKMLEGSGRERECSKGRGESEDMQQENVQQENVPQKNVQQENVDVPADY